jgi:hypothetical protein
MLLNTFLQLLVKLLNDSVEPVYLTRQEVVLN